MPKYLFAVPTFLILFSASILRGDTIRVPEDAETIQGGIDIAIDGDTVLVADGYYTGPGNRDIDFFGKRIVVMSEDGPWVTTIDCEGDSLDPHRGFYFHSGEDQGSVVNGFTIRGGFASIEGLDGFGGGIYCNGSSPTIKGNHIVKNRAELNGGGICCLYGSSPVIDDNLIAGNLAENTGGGIWCDKSQVTLTGNFITGNTGVWAGGGIYIDYASPVITRTVFSHNMSYRGGGIYCFDASPVLEKCTISKNISSSSGGGLFGIYYSSPSMNNCIAWGDSPDELDLDLGDPSITYSDVEGGWTGIGNINADPLFVLPERRDFRLLWDSPCIDMGDPSLIDPDSTRCDIGSFPFDQTDYLTIYLTPDTTWVTPGAQLGVTYTVINRWPQSESYWLLSQGLLPGGAVKRIFGPNQYTIPQEYTTQDYYLHNVPQLIPPARYEYWTRIGIRTPYTLYDDDRFFVIVGD
jgi:hypothetical protein